MGCFAASAKIFTQKICLQKPPFLGIIMQAILNEQDAQQAPLKTALLKLVGCSLLNAGNVISNVLLRFHYLPNSRPTFSITHVIPTIVIVH